MTCIIINKYEQKKNANFIKNVYFQQQKIQIFI